MLRNCLPAVVGFENKHRNRVRKAVWAARSEATVADHGERQRLRSIQLTRKMAGRRFHSTLPMKTNQATTVWPATVDRMRLQDNRAAAWMK